MAIACIFSVTLVFSQDGDQRKLADQLEFMDRDESDDEIAEETGWSVNQVVLVWLLQHDPFTLPLISAGTMDQLKENLAVAELSLTVDQLQRLDKAGV